MIYGSFKNLSNYKGISTHMDKALAFVEANDLNAFEAGKHPIDGDNVFLLMNEYTTKPVEDCVIESHRKYIDIQIMLDGTELFGYAPLEDQAVLESYNDEKDYIFYQAEMNYLTLKADYFAIFYPSDLHQPGIAADKPEKIKKAVIKVRVN